MNFHRMSLCCRLLIGVIFILACIHKIAFPFDFARIIARYELLPDNLVNLAALALPWIELVIAGTIIFSRRFREAAAWGAGGLLLLFIAAISIKMFQGVEIHCGCFTSSAAAGSEIGPENILRNSGLLILCAFVIYVEQIPLKET